MHHILDVHFHVHFITTLLARPCHVVKLMQLKEKKIILNPASILTDLLLSSSSVRWTSNNGRTCKHPTQNIFYASHALSLQFHRAALKFRLKTSLAH